jgi:hypothetical protein
MPDAVRTAYSVYADVIARKYQFNLDPHIIEDAVQLYKNWFPYSWLLAYQTTAKEIVATSCATLKTPGICILLDDDFIKFAKSRQLECVGRRFYYGSLTSVNKPLLEKLSMPKGISYALYKDLNLVLASQVLRDQNAIYLADFEKTAFMLVTRALHMPWQQIGKESPWLGSLNIPSYIPLGSLRSWVEKNEE